MKQVVQAVSGGPVRVLDVPRPTIDATQVLVQTVASVISPGTERAVTALAQSSLLAKARSRPDLVRQLIRKAKTEGIGPASRAVRSRLGGDLPLGYSAAGVALEVGEAVSGVVPGQLVATAGAGRANHAEFQAVPGLLCCAVPDGVAPEEAAFATIASIALHGFRLADVGPGSKLVVIGLGLVGQLTVRLARASGCDVAAIDLSDFAVERGIASGALALLESGDDTAAAILDWSRGRGADAVIITASGRSSGAISRTPALCRDRSSVVIVGDVGLDIERTPFYERELSIQFARSYGPGRYERSYEDWAVDYPPGFVRWTEGRNLEAVLDLMASHRLKVADLVTHRFGITDAAAAYELIESRSEPHIAVALAYPQQAAPERPIPLRTTSRNKRTDEPGIGLIGAGAFASTVLVPAFKQAGFSRFVAVTSASGLSARRLGERAGFNRAVSTAESVIDDPDVEVVVIATPHDTHAQLATRALRADKHVFCEKPLALTMEELEEVEGALRESGKVLFVGFNRRWSESVLKVRRHFADGTGPLVITYRVNAGPVPTRHWYNDRRQGGRILGEMCHFVDTCDAIVGVAASRVNSLTGTPAGLLAGDNVLVGLQYPDGSIASIAYATDGRPGMPKERIEVLGRGRSAVINDFRSIDLDSKNVSFGQQDKGHVAQVGSFRGAIRDGAPLAVGVASMRSTLLAAASLLSVEG